jgi:hypothetical protein
VRTGPRHAAPKKPLFTRLHVPAGKAIALAAMPTAVLMGMGFTPTLALADDQPASKSLTADEYKDCLTALEDGASASASPSPSASASGDDSKDTSAGDSGSADKGDTAEPNPSPSSDGSGSSDGSSSSDSGSGDKADPTPSPSASPSKESDAASDTATATPSPSASDDGNLLEDIGDAITGVFTGGTKATESASPTPSASPSAPSGADDSASTAKDPSDAVKDTTEKVTGTVNDTVKDTTDSASKAAEDTTKAVEKAAGDVADEATASPSPSAGSTTDAEDCPVATDAVGDVDNAVPLPDDPWYLNASSLLLKGADYKGVVEVRTASGKVKKVLKYVISGGTDIGDLHQTVKDAQSGKTYHVQAGKGTTSTIRDGDTIMYTESISGNLFGLIPITFDPDNPPPLNIPLIYFTNAKVQQAGQFGGTLTVPGLHQYATG